MNDLLKKVAIKKDSPLPTGLKFLLVEDSDNYRLQMLKDLNSLGGVAGKIHEAIDVTSAMKQVETELFDFIISDWNLPDGTGLDFLKHVRATDKHKKTPFIICTTNDEINYFLSAVASGANDYLVKPWKVEELEKKIKSVLHLQSTKGK